MTMRSETGRSETGPSETGSSETGPSEKEKTGDSRLRRWRLVVLSSFMVLAGCDWIPWFGSSTPATGERVRPGAERQFGASAGLPSAGAGRAYDAGIAPVDETRGGGQLGSIVTGKGGQKAQLDAAAQDAAKRDAQTRETRAKAEREAELKKSPDGAAPAPASAAPSPFVPTLEGPPPAPPPPATPQ